jgi:hypothetical protein
MGEGEKGYQPTEKEMKKAEDRLDYEEKEGSEQREKDPKLYEKSYELARKYFPFLLLRNGRVWHQDIWPRRMHTFQAFLEDIDMGAIQRRELEGDIVTHLLARISEGRRRIIRELSDRRELRYLYNTRSIPTGGEPAGIRGKSSREAEESARERLKELYRAEEKLNRGDINAAVECLRFNLMVFDLSDLAEATAISSRGPKTTSLEIEQEVLNDMMLIDATYGTDEKVDQS